jgi:predicted transcriptional regulator
MLTQKERIFNEVTGDYQTTGEIAKKVGITSSHTSIHLQALHKEGRIDKREKRNRMFQWKLYLRA